MRCTMCGGLVQAHNNHRLQGLCAARVQGPQVSSGGFHAHHFYLHAWQFLEINNSNKELLYGLGPRINNQKKFLKITSEI